MDRVALDLGFLQVYWYSIFAFIAILTGTFIVFLEARKKQIDEDFLTNLIFNTILIGILGARAYYVLFNISYYITNPIEILEIWNGGLAIHGGIIAGGLFMAYYCKKNDVKFIDILDIAVVGLIIGQAIGRWGNFFNSEAFGGVTTYEELMKAGIPKFVINGMYILGAYRQPTFFYESIWCIFGFLSILMIRKMDKYLKKGQITGFYLIWYGVCRFLIEEMRYDALMLGPIKVAQLVSLVFVGLGLYLFLRYNKKEEKEYYYRYVEPKNVPGVVYFK